MDSRQDLDPVRGLLSWVGFLHKLSFCLEVSVQYTMDIMTIFDNIIDIVYHILQYYRL